MPLSSASATGQTPPYYMVNQKKTSSGKTSTKMQNLIKPDPLFLAKLHHIETDDRFKYLLKYGNVQFVDTKTSTLFVELAQIPNVIVVYRRPSERLNNAEKLSLEHHGLKHMPLLEGEEALKHLSFAHNDIPKIENIVSLPELESLDISQNKL